MDFASFAQGFGVCIFALILVLVMDRRAPSNLRWALSLFALSGLNNVLDGPDLLGAAHAAWMWLVMLVLFDDRALRPVLFIPAGLLFAAAGFHDFLGLFDGPTGGPALAAGMRLAGILLMLHGLYVVLRTWRGDLMETRRRIRLWAAVAGVVTMTVFVSLAIAQRFGLPEPAWLRVASYAAQMVMLFANLAPLFQLRENLLPSRAAAASPASANVRLIMARLEQVMERDEAWRREGLTIAALAAMVGTSERQLRRLINEALGHRNFTAFLNSYRVPAAQERLADPEEAGRTVADIAFALGYVSLSPFNRAFREATGQTPTEWRRRALA